MWRENSHKLGAVRVKEVIYGIYLDTLVEPAIEEKKGLVITGRFFS